jgi:stress response protein SCP2
MAQNFNLLKDHSMARPGTAKLTKAKLKNQRRNQRRRAKKMKALAESGKMKALVEGAAGSASAPKIPQGQSSTAPVQVSAVLLQPSDRLSSPIERTPRHVLTGLVGFIEVEDLRALLCTSKRLSKEVNDSWVWRELFIRGDAQQKQPGAIPSVQASKNWRRWFDLHFDTCVASNLRCFIRLCTMQDDVLGFPLDFTRNPRTKRTDYVGVFADSVLSKTAWTNGHRRSIWSHQAIAWLPMYLTDEHFHRALPCIRRTIAEIAVAKTAKFVPGMVLDVLPQAMKTLTLQIANNGVAASSRTADAFVQLHRLFVALVQEYPILRKQIFHRLSTFIKGNEQNRSKKSCPNQGDLFPLLTVCAEYGYEQLVRPYFMEQLDRGVLWVCRDFPHMAKRSMRIVGRGADENLLQCNWEARLLANRLVLINRAIINLLRPSSSMSRCCMRHDYLLGHATPQAKALFVQNIKDALAVDKWGPWLKLADLKMKSGALPSPAMLTDFFKKAVDNSERRGYHKRGMSFSKIHRSGGSRLMQRGDRCELGSLGKVSLRDTWRYAGGCKYLDASVLAFDFNGKYTGIHVDYASTRENGLSHSGDIIDRSDKKGTHTVDCELRYLHRNVASLFIVLSAFSEATLDDILSPCVIVEDKNTGIELCRYQLDEETTQGDKAVVMCGLHRRTLRGAWHVDAIGAVQKFGDATNYSPIVFALERRLKEQRDSRSRLEAGTSAISVASEGKVDEHRQFKDDWTWQH